MNNMKTKKQKIISNLMRKKFVIIDNDSNIFIFLILGENPEKNQNNLNLS